MLISAGMSGMESTLTNNFRNLLENRIGMRLGNLYRLSAGMNDVKFTLRCHVGEVVFELTILVSGTQVA